MIRTNEFISDLHAHTLYCDGTASPDAMVKEAIKKGFKTLGFSGHSYIENVDWCMNEQSIEEYKSEIAALKQEYSGTIEILCGIEQDSLSGPTPDGFDYSIGSVHYINKDGVLLAVDETPEITAVAVNQYYGGDYLKFAEDYFLEVSRVIEKTGAEIIGHFDLISKFCEQSDIIKPDSKEYKALAFAAAKELLKTDAFFEINTGAISRGYRTSPYPSADILKFIGEKGGKIVFCSDAHSPAAIGAYFHSAAVIAKAAGFKTHYIFQNGIWCEKPL